MINRIVQEDQTRRGGQSSLTADAVRLVVNRMFEEGKKYDEYSAVKKELASVLGKSMVSPVVSTRFAVTVLIVFIAISH